MDAEIIHPAVTGGSGIMQKLNKPSPAVAELDRLETSFDRALNRGVNLGWWTEYYKMRLTQIATHHNLVEDDLMYEWMKWKTTQD